MPVCEACWSRASLIASGREPVVDAYSRLLAGGHHAMTAKRGYSALRDKYVRRVKDFLLDYHRATGRADIPLSRIRGFLHQSSAGTLEEVVIAALQTDEVIEGIVGEGRGAVVAISHQWIAAERGEQ